MGRSAIILPLFSCSRRETRDFEGRYSAWECGKNGWTPQVSYSGLVLGYFCCMFKIGSGTGLSRSAFDAGDFETPSGG